MPPCNITFDVPRYEPFTHEELQDMIRARGGLSKEFWLTSIDRDAAKAAEGGDEGDAVGHAPAGPKAKAKQAPAAQPGAKRAAHRALLVRALPSFNMGRAAQVQD
jgi:hypothetical protein